MLRWYLVYLGDREAHLHGTHDFRRGHARDILQRGGTLADILQAGEWRSAAFLSYLSKEELADAAADDAHLLSDALDDPSEDEC